MLRQPKCCVRIPPKKGPKESPTYTAPVFMPMALPLSLVVNTEVRIATVGPHTIAPPTPCRALKEISMIVELEIAQQKDETVESRMPYVKIFLLPYISAILPNGTMATADARTNDVATHPSKIASMENSSPIVGSAIGIAVGIKHVTTLASVVIINTAFLFVLLSEVLIISAIIPETG